MTSASRLLTQATKRVTSTPEARDSAVSRPLVEETAAVAPDDFGQLADGSVAAAVSQAPSLPSPSFGKRGLFTHQAYLPETRVRVAPGQSERASGGLPLSDERYGTLLGHDQFGRAVIQVDGAERLDRVNFARLAPELPAGANSKTLQETLARGEVFFDGLPSTLRTPAPPRLLSALSAALEQPAVGTHSAREYVDAFQQAGHRTWLIGGAIRDVLHELATNPSVDDAVLLGHLKDIDLVVDALPGEVREIAHRLNPELPDDGIWTPSSIDRFGVVGLGDRKTGLDVATLRLGGLADGKGSVLGKRLTDDTLGRDFTVNQLYLDLEDLKLLDPTGRGVADSEQRTLVVNARDPDSNPMLPFRFLKFRARGFGSEAGTRKLMGEQAELHWSKLAQSPGRLANEFLRIAPTDASTEAQLRGHIDVLRDIAQQDGFGAQFTQYVDPNVDAIVSKFLERKAGGA